MMLSSRLLTSVSLGLLTLVNGRACDSNGKPTATVKNGTYYGIHNPELNQDFFLGMPFAKVSEYLVSERYSEVEC